MLLLIISLSIQVFFSPNGGARDAILEEIRNANNEINVAMYVLTDRELSNALVSAKERGVKVKVLLDGKSAEEIGYSKHYFLSERNVNVKLDNTHKTYGNKYEGIMHNKFAIIDNKTLITGSFNWTHSAEELNDENLLIIKEDTSLIRKYTDKFIKLWERGNVANKPVRLDPYKLKELKKNIDKWVIISGRPTNWNVSRSGHLFIDFGMGKEQFTFVLWKEGVEKLKGEGFDLNKLNKKEIELKGKLIDHKKYGLEITTSDPEAISFVE
jgi:phosphatidylserine/phosphatidylglycerophosphate/cardiolipin synthase-like enzyme